MHEVTGERQRPSSTLLLQFYNSKLLYTIKLYVPLLLVILTDILKFFLDERTRHSEQTTNEQFYSDVIIPLLPHTNPQQDLCKQNRQLIERYCEAFLVSVCISMVTNIIGIELLSLSHVLWLNRYN
jgi:hypothetical protein